MKKRMDKKAIALRSVLLLLLGLAAVVLVVLGALGVFENTIGKLDLFPGDLEAAAQSCGISATQNLKTSYCYEFKEVKIGGTKQYITCEKLESYAEFDKLTGCDETMRDAASTTLCRTLKDNAIVNKKVCWQDGQGEDEWGFSKNHLTGE